VGRDGRRRRQRKSVWAKGDGGSRAVSWPLEAFSGDYGVENASPHAVIQAQSHDGKAPTGVRRRGRRMAGTRLRGQLSRTSEQRATASKPALRPGSAGAALPGRGNRPPAAGRQTSPSPSGTQPQRRGPMGPRGESRAPNRGGVICGGDTPIACTPCFACSRGTRAKEWQGHPALKGDLPRGHGAGRKTLRRRSVV